MSLLTNTPLFFAADAAPGAGGGLSTLLFFGLIFAAMYFLLIAPQRKKQKAHDKMLKSLATGDEIVTSGGIYGQITNVKDDRFVVRVSDNTKIEIGKSFVSAVVRQAGGKDDNKDEKGK